MKNLYTRFIIFVSLYAASVLVPQEILAQKEDFFISRIDTSEFPLIKADFTATDALGYFRTDLQSSNFTVFENGTQIAPSLVTTQCDDIKLDPEVSVVLVMDRSWSMDIRQNGISDRIEWLKYGSSTFLDNLNFYGRTSVAVVGFSSTAGLISPFLQDKEALKDSINKKLLAGGTTNYNNPFLNPYDGVIDLFKTRDQDVRKVVIFMTDGDPDPNIQIQTQKIVDSLLHYRIQVFTIAVYLPTNDFLANVARFTGGQTYNAYTREELANIYKLLALESQLSQKCRVQWISPYGCTELDRIRNAKVTFLPLGKVENLDFTAPPRSTGLIKASESILSFGDTPIGQDVTLPVTITAERGDFLVNDVSILPGGFFRIAPDGITVGGVPKTPPFMLNAGQSLTVNIIFTQKERQIFRQAELFINSSPCQQRVTLVGGLSQVQLITPNGDKPGNVRVPYKTCDTIDIQWAGIERNEPVNLYFSTSDAQPWVWIPIASNVTGFSYKWKAPQAGITYRVKVEMAGKKVWQWSKQFGGIGDDAGESIDVSPNGFFEFVGGHFEQSIELPGSGLTSIASKGQKDFFAVKYDTDGNPLWMTSAGGPGDDRALAVVSDPQNNVYVTGYTSPGASFGSQNLQHYTSDSNNLFVAKYTGKSNTPEWLIYSRGQGVAQRGFAQGTKITYGIDRGVEYIYVQVDYKFFNEFVGLATSVRFGNGSAATQTGILRIATTNPFTVSFVNSLPPGVQFPADKKRDVDATQNEYFTGKFFPTLRGSFDPTYKLPGIPDLTTNGRNDAFIAKIGGVPGSSDSSDHLFMVDAPSIQFTLMDGTIIPSEDIGSIAVGQTLPVILKAVLRNTGTTDILLDDAIFSGPDASEFALASSVKGIVLKAGATITVELHFRPSEVGPRTATLAILGSCDVVASIVVNATGLIPCSTTAQPVAFEAIGLNTTSTKTIPCLLKYEGLVPVAVRPFLTGNDAISFTFNITSHTRDGNGFVTLQPGECLAGVVTFSPSEGRTYLAHIEYEGLEECGDPVTQIGGYGLRPYLVLGQKNWEKKRMLTSHTGMIFLQNKDEVDALIDEIRLSDPATQDFTYQIVSPAGITFPYLLKPEESIEITVGFTPTSATGILNTNIEVRVNSFPNPLIGNLIGTGVLPVIEARDTSFKGTLVGTLSDEIIDVPVYNRSADTSLYIEKIDVLQNDGGDFILPAFASNFSIRELQSYIAQIRFRPSAAGIRFLRLKITSDAAAGPTTDPRVETVMTITGEGLDVNVHEVPPFKNVLTCEALAQKVTFANTSATETLYITGFTQISGVPGYFSIMPQNITILPQTSADITVTYTPDNTGNHISEFAVENSFKKPMSIRLEGDARTARLALTTDALPEATPGEVITVPVHLTTEDLGSVAITSIKFHIAFDHRLLRLKGISGLLNWNFTAVPISKDLTEISGTGPALPGNAVKTALLNILLEVYLLNQKSTEVVISNIETGYKCIVSPQSATSFTLGEICFPGARNISLSSTQYMLQEVHPNPVSDEARIVFGVGLDGRTVITLHNSAGVLVETVLDAVLKEGLYESSVSLRNIPSGVYFYTIHSGPFTATQKLIVVE
ncbi:MAG TPA: choice-of-anchor D domain-containing protein [Patescibacteria group bacterium]|nr:choice-of-anchor D domain-containing protein [Patescibacteria group bacterium]